MTRLQWCAFFIVYMIFMILLFMIDPAQGAENMGHTHEGVVGAFYQKWNRADQRDATGARYQSCCGGTDCRPILGIRKHPSGYTSSKPAQWEVLLLKPGMGSTDTEWFAVADSKWEDNYPDQEESPDGRGHACVNFSGDVLCALRAAGM